jgi:hypothetical protein
MFCQKGKTNPDKRDDTGLANRQVDEKIKEYVTHAQEAAFNRFVTRAHRTPYDDYEDKRDSRMKLAGVAVAVGIVAFTAGRFVPIQEPIRNHPSEIPAPTPSTVPMKVVTYERTQRFEEEKAEPAPAPVAPFVDTAVPAACPHMTGREAGAIDARRLVAEQVFSNVVPIRVSLGSNGQERVRVSTAILFDKEGKAHLIKSDAYALNKGSSSPVAKYVAPNLGSVGIAPLEHPCVLNLVDTIPPG